MTTAFYFILEISHVVKITSYLQLIGVAQKIVTVRSFLQFLKTTLSLTTAS